MGELVFLGETFFAEFLNELYSRFGVVPKEFTKENPFLVDLIKYFLLFWLITFLVYFLQKTRNTFFWILWVLVWTGGFWLFVMQPPPVNRVGELIFDMHGLQRSGIHKQAIRMGRKSEQPEG